MIRNLPGDIRIIGTGIAVPEQAVTNSQIRERINPHINEKWVEHRLGIKSRHIASDNQNTSDLAVTAAQNAITREGINPDSIDLIILATATPDKRAPATACLVQHQLGITNAAAFDVSAVCCGFLYALTTASAYLRSGLAKRALVIGADTFSKVTDWARRDCVFFGDGAGAAILESSSYHNTFDAVLCANGAHSDAFYIEDDRSTFQMNAQAVYNAAEIYVPQCIRTVLSRSELTTNDIDIVIPHQPSVNLLKAIANRSNIAYEKFVINIARYGNTAAATIPIALHETICAGQIKDQDLVLFAAAGAGFTAGAALYRWH